MTVIDDTKYLMQKYKIHPNKGLGQNFLVDEEALNLIAQDVTKQDTIIEIGPGLGTLTNILLNKAKKVISENKIITMLMILFGIFSIMNCILIYTFMQLLKNI